MSVFVQVYQSKVMHILVVNLVGSGSGQIQVCGSRPDIAVYEGGIPTHEQLCTASCLKIEMQRSFTCLLSFMYYG